MRNPTVLLVVAFVVFIVVLLVVGPSGAVLI